MQLHYRFLWPVTLVSVTLAGLCGFTAFALLRQQLSITETLREDVASHRAATELEECLIDALALLRVRVESVAVLHDRTRLHLKTIRLRADRPEEQQMADRLQAGFDRYMAEWRAMPPPGKPGRDQAVRDATRILETDLLRACQEFEQFNARRIEETTEHHEWLTRQLAWGMAGVGMLGGVAGLVLGFGVARALSLSIRRLQVQIQDAAGKLGRNLPRIVLTQEGDFAGLHEQVDQLRARIETFVLEMQQREREVFRAEQLAAVGQLAAGVAHEIRNPLASIKMLVQAELEAGSAEGMPREDLQVMESAVRRMERSLHSFLAFARPPRAERRPFEVTKVVEPVLELIHGRAEKQRVRLELVRPCRELTITADAGQVQQVLVNLALNALDAMPNGGGLTLAIRAEGGEIQLEVSDTGPGIPAEMADRLFQPFASTKDTGLGLGLVICKRIVEDHGGTIRPVARPGKGATLLVTLPAR